MECHHPLTIRKPGTSYIDDEPLKVACGKCPACDLNRINQWKTRAKAEFKYASNGWFVTLTYNDDNLPFDPETGISTLVKKDYQLFLKKLRKRYSYLLKNSEYFNEGKIRYLICGEYGSSNYRPHYHIILFNVPMPVISINTPLNDVIEKVKECWNLGKIHVGPLRMGAIDYVVSYITGSRFGFDDRGRLKPFLEMSRRPGIGIDYVTFNYEYHHAEHERAYTMSKAFKNSPMPRYFRRKLYNDPELKIIASELKEHFEDRRIEEDANYLLHGVDPEEMRKAKRQQDFKKMKFKKTKKFRT